MLRIAGVNIPEKKHILIGLQDIYGIGRATAKVVCEHCGVDLSRKGSDLSDAEVERLRTAIAHYVVEGDKRREVQLRIKHLKDIKCYRGLRHHRKLPVRGQRTRTNAQTARRGRRGSGG